MRICQLLVTQLQILLDPACDMATQQTELKVVLRVMRTVLRNFYRQLRTKCGVFIEALLAGGIRCLCASHRPSRHQHGRTLFTEAEAAACWPRRGSQLQSCSVCGPGSLLMFARNLGDLLQAPNPAAASGSRSTSCKSCGSCAQTPTSFISCLSRMMRER